MTILSKQPPFYVKFQWFFLISMSIGLFFCYPASSEAPLSAKIDIDYTSWDSYAANLQFCSLGKFVLPDPTKITQLRQRLDTVTTEGPDVQEKIRKELSEATSIYEIFGWKDQQCQVSILDKPEDVTTPPTAGPTGFDCSFSKNEVDILVITAKTIAVGNLPLNWTDPDVNIKGRACKAKLNSLPPLSRPPARVF